MLQDVRTNPKLAPIIDRAEVHTIAVVRENGTWMAMKSSEYKEFHNILAYGEVLPRNVANFLFPAFGQAGYDYTKE